MMPNPNEDRFVLVILVSLFLSTLAGCSEVESAADPAVESTKNIQGDADWVASWPGIRGLSPEEFAERFVTTGLGRNLTGPHPTPSAVEWRTTEDGRGCTFTVLMTCDHSGDPKVVRADVINQGLKESETDNLATSRLVDVAKSAGLTQKAQEWVRQNAQQSALQVFGSVEVETKANVARVRSLRISGK